MRLNPGLWRESGMVMAARIFIDGEAGTTGLQIAARLDQRRDIELLRLDDTLRKDQQSRREMLNAADLVVLCLPDEAARQAVSMIENPDVRVIDASTAHRVAADWVYGMPELTANQAGLIASAKRVTNPGCYALSSIAMLHPLVAAGILPADTAVTINAVSGYSGGGRQMIEQFEDASAANHIDTPFRVYGLGLEHKHVPEIQARSGLRVRPIFVPSVGRFRQGMIVQIPLHLADLPGNPTPTDIHAALVRHYDGQTFIEVAEMQADPGPLDPEGLNGTNRLRLHVYGHAGHGHAVIAGLLDNLGKGASGQAVQNINLMLGLAEDEGLGDQRVVN